MIGALKQAFSRIYATIPYEILEATFQDSLHETSLDEAINKKVIQARVRDDISLRGGKVMKIILDPTWSEYTPMPSYYTGQPANYSVYKIPPEARDYRDIVAIMHIRYPYLSASNGMYRMSCAGSAGNSLATLAGEALSAQTFANINSTPVGVLMEGNVIKLTPAQITMLPWQLEVRLAYDPNFTAMEVAETKLFMDVCEQAVKAYIHTNMMFKIESNLVQRGMELGVFKDIVTGFSDANEKYDELLLAHGGSNYFDTSRLIGLMGMMVPRR